MKSLLTSTPEQQGIDSQAISAFLNEAKATLHYLHSFSLMRHRQVIAEGWWSPYEPTDPHIMFSVSKSFTSTAVGMAIAEGRLKVSDPVISFFPDELPPVISPNLAAMQVQHLLSMSTGHAIDTTSLIFEPGVTRGTRAFLAVPVEHKPGTHFLYNTGATYILSAIIQKLTGQTLLEYLTPRLFEPLGLENPSWEISAEGISTGGVGLGITTADLLKFGQLYLQKGVWNGKSLISQEWLKAATTKQSDNSAEANPDWQQGYGYQFWVCRHGAYRGDGAFGQFCLVMPEQDAVLAITAGLEDMQPVLNLVWKHLLPAMTNEPLPENPAAHQELSRQLEELEISPLKNVVNETVAAEVSGKRFTIAENDWEIGAISFDFTQPDSVITIENASGTAQLTPGNGSWKTGISTINKGFPRKVATSGGWTDNQTYQIKLFFLTPILTQTPPALTIRPMPFDLTLTCRFEGQELSLDLQVDISFNGTYGQQLKGKL